MPAQRNARSAHEIAATNRTFYDALWSQSNLERPERFNTWPLIAPLLPRARHRLELGPGLRPRLPIAGTHFVDISPPVISRLNANGGVAVYGDIVALPFADRTFDLVCAHDVIEHVSDDRRVFAEMSRVLKDNGLLIFSVPVHSDRWTEIDDWVGHVRRYDPEDLLRLVADHQLQIERSAAFGMQPSSRGLVRFGMWWMTHHRGLAMRSYNRIIMPLGMYFQKPLRLVDNLIDTTGVDAVVLVCRCTAPRRRLWTTGT